MRKREKFKNNIWKYFLESHKTIQSTHIQLLAVENSINYF